MKQHYVPQFYYRNFGDTVWCLDKTNEKRFPTSPKNISFERDFYGPEINGEYPLEKILSRYEAKFNVVISELIKIEDFNNLSAENKIHVCTFAALQYLRTKETRLRIMQAVNAFLGQVSHTVGVDDWTMTMTEEGAMAMHLKRMLDFPAYATAMLRMKVVIVRNRTDIPFWTSDNPTVFQNELEQPPYGNLGFLSRGIRLHLPLTPNLAIVFFDPTIFNGLPNVIDLSDPETIIRENYLQAISSTRFLISNSDGFFQATDMLHEIPELKDPNRQRVTTIKNSVSKPKNPFQPTKPVVARKGPDLWANPVEFEQLVKRFNPDPEPTD